MKSITRFMLGAFSAVLQSAACVAADNQALTTLQTGNRVRLEQAVIRPVTMREMKKGGR